MQVKQIFILFWWIVAISVVLISGMKINSLKFEVTPEDISKEVALTASRLSSLDANSEISYPLEKDAGIKIENNKVTYLLNGIEVGSYAYLGGDIEISEKEEGLVLKNGQR